MFGRRGTEEIQIMTARVAAWTAVARSMVETRVLDLMVMDGKCFGNVIRISVEWLVAVRMRDVCCDLVDGSVSLWIRK